MSRRFISEFGLNMVANGAVLLQDEQLAALGDMLPPDAPSFHIYLVGALPRISIAPERFDFTDTMVRGAFRVHHQDEALEIEVAARQPPEKRLDRVKSDYPHTVALFYSGDELVTGGKAALLGTGFPAMQRYLNFEVLYAGQSYGSNGDRVAQDRLQSHSTLQRILGETSRRQPDREIWLALLHFEEFRLASFDGVTANEPGALEEDEGRIERFSSSHVSDQQKINLVEAALISYFKPKYNKLFRETFPSPAHKAYSECYAIDLNMVSVEVDTTDIVVKLCSAAVAPSQVHLAAFPLHRPEQRRYMMDLLDPAGKWKES